MIGIIDSRLYYQGLVRIFRNETREILLGPGGYSARDYVKPGGILTILFIIIATTLIYLLV